MDTNDTITDEPTGLDFVPPDLAVREISPEEKLRRQVAELEEAQAKLAADQAQLAADTEKLARVPIDNAIAEAVKAATDELQDRLDGLNAMLRRQLS
jgi:hypothetical protein